MGREEEKEGEFSRLDMAPLQESTINFEDKDDGAAQQNFVDDGLMAAFEEESKEQEVSVLIHNVTSTTLCEDLE